MLSLRSISLVPCVILRRLRMTRVEASSYHPLSPRILASPSIALAWERKQTHESDWHWRGRGGNLPHRVVPRAIRQPLYEPCVSGRGDRLLPVDEISRPPLRRA